MNNNAISGGIIIFIIIVLVISLSDGKPTPPCDGPFIKKCYRTEADFMGKTDIQTKCTKDYDYYIMVTKEYNSSCIGNIGSKVYE